MGARVNAAFIIQNSASSPVRHILWLAAGGAAAIGLFFVTRKTEAAFLFPQQQFYGETQKIPLAVPVGWRRVTSTEVSALPELRTRAISLLSSSGFTSTPYGTLTPFTASNGATYATWVEQHYHVPGGTAKPWGLHHGVTLLAQTTPGVLLDECWR